MKKCQQCPLVDGYRFKSKCRVESCKYFTNKTQHRCMAIDTVFSSSDKGTTDAELRFLKLPERSKREVFVLRREAKEKVQAVLVLYHAARICREEMDDNIFPTETPVMNKVAQHQLFHDPDMGLELWMVEYLFDKKFMKRFNNPKIHILFNITDKELEQSYPSSGE